MEDNYELTFKDKVTLWWIMVTWMVGLYTTFKWLFTGLYALVEWIVDKFDSKKADRKEDDDLF